MPKIGSDRLFFSPTFRSSLSPLIVEALICIQVWLKNHPINNGEFEKDFVESYDEHGI
jgi:hypothetical protein